MAEADKGDVQGAKEDLVHFDARLQVAWAGSSRPCEKRSMEGGGAGGGHVQEELWPRLWLYKKHSMIYWASLTVLLHLPCWSFLFYSAAFSFNFFGAFQHKMVSIKNFSLFVRLWGKGRYWTPMKCA